MYGLARLFIIIGILTLFISGCASTPEVETAEEPQVTEEPDTSAEDSEAMGAEVETEGVSGAGDFQGDPLDDPNSLLAKRIVYFEFDSAVVSDEFSATVEAHAAYLADHPQARLTLEGHTDERGTREYNLGLGERRAQAVKQFLALMGGSSRQIQTVSYGEERPAVDGHSESAWQRNRRVELVYQR